MNPEIQTLRMIIDIPNELFRIIDIYLSWDEYFRDHKLRFHKAIDYNDNNGDKIYCGALFFRMGSLDKYKYQTYIEVLIKSHEDLGIDINRCVMLRGS